MNDIDEKDDDNNEEIVLMTRNFKKCLKYKKLNYIRKTENKKSINGVMFKCYDCGESSHLRRDCGIRRKRRIH